MSRENGIQIDAFDGTFPRTPAPADSDLRPPPARRGFVQRRELVDRLLATDADVIALIAPSGYGKTTTLAQWARAETAPLAWLSLQRSDNDAKVLLCHLAASLERIGLMDADDVAFFQLMDDSEAPAMGVNHFARRLEGSSQPPIMIIDDVGVLSSRAAKAVASELLRLLEGVARIAIASHSTPAVRLPSVRASGRLLEVTDEHLSLSLAEVEQLITGLGLDRHIARDVLDSTEGWPAAVFHMVAATRNRTVDVAEVRIEQRRHLDEFVKSEIVPLLSKRRRQFLTLMAPLERMSGPLCDAVSDAPGSRRLLESLERETRLVHQVDPEAKWFLMTRALRDTLLAELEHNDPEGLRVVHSRAAAWYEANDMPRQAIDHAEKAGDTVPFAHLMGRLIKAEYANGHVADVLQWMDWLQRKVPLDQFPDLAAIGALVHLQEGNALETERWLDAASRGATEADAGSVIWLVRAAATRSGVGQMLLDVEVALETAAPGSRWLPAILLTKGLAHLMDGDVDLAEPSFAEAARIGLENESMPAVTSALGQRALIAIGRQDWDLATSLVDQSLAIIDDRSLDGYHTSGLALAAAARLARRNNDMTRTQKLLARASTVRPRLSVTFPGESVQILVEMARAHVELSNIAVARVLIREADEIVVQLPDLGVLAEDVASIKESIAGLGPGKAGLPALTKAELRLLPLLATHMSFPEIGEQLFVSRHTIKSQATSIYRKLRSSTRSEAIAKAYDIGLLSR